MIRIVKDGICKDCPHAELELSELRINSDRIWKIRCGHAQACARIIEEMMSPKETK